MSNFVDSQNMQVLTNFSPYVQQQPVEIMAQVGQRKQQMYEQGIQRIQESVDKIAGLDVVRDVDRKYLQSKLNTLDGDLRRVAAGDFSNFQLVNSVGGMINSIAKDSNVQNAVSSTMKYRKGVSDMESSIKEGKSSPSNEWDFTNQVQSWIYNPDVKASFSGGYNPYTNYKKNALEAIKSLTKDENINEDAFTFDNRGNLVITDAIVRKKFAGISPEKIQQALSATLTPSDFKQMEIDGRYNYSNITPQRLSQVVNESSQNKVNFYSEQRRILQNAKSSTTSVLEQLKVDEQIASLDKLINNISSENSQLNEMIASGNTEAVKAHLHTNDFLNNFSKAFSYTETSVTHHDSPYAQAARWREDVERDWLKFNMNYSQKEREIDLKKTENKLKEKELSGYGGLPGPVDQSTLPQIDLSKIVETTNNELFQLNSLDNQFLNGKSKEWLGQQLDAYDRGAPIDAGTKLYIQSTEPLRRKALGQQAMVVQARKEAAKEKGIRDIDNYINELIPENAQNVSFSDGESSYTYTPFDFIDFNSKLQDYVKGVSQGGIVSYDHEKAKKELSKKDYNLFYLTANKGYIGGKTSLNENEKNLLNNLTFYGENVNAPAGNMLKEIGDISEQKLKERIPIMQGKSYSIPTGNTEQKRSMDNNLSGFIQIAQDQNGKLPYSPDFDIDEAKKIIGDPNAQYRITIVEGTRFQEPMYEINVTGENTSTRFRVTEEQKNSMFSDRFEASPEIKSIRHYQEQLRMMGGRTTAFDGKTTNHNNAYLSKIDFNNPDLRYYGIKANLISPVPSSPNLYQLRLSIYDPTKKSWIEDIGYPRNNLLSEEAVKAALDGIGDGEIFELVNNRRLTSQDLQVLKTEHEKPL